MCEGRVLEGLRIGKLGSRVGNRQHPTPAHENRPKGIQSLFSVQFSGAPGSQVLVWRDSQANPSELLRLDVLKVVRACARIRPLLNLCRVCLMETDLSAGRQQSCVLAGRGELPQLGH